MIWSCQRWCLWTWFCSTRNVRKQMKANTYSSRFWNWSVVPPVMSKTLPASTRCMRKYHFTLSSRNPCWAVQFPHQKRGCGWHKSWHARRWSRRRIMNTHYSAPCSRDEPRCIRDSSWYKSRRCLGVKPTHPWWTRKAHYISWRYSLWIWGPWCHSVQPTWNPIIWPTNSRAHLPVTDRTASSHRRDIWEGKHLIYQHHYAPLTPGSEMIHSTRKWWTIFGYTINKVSFRLFLRNERKCRNLAKSVQDSGIPTIEVYLLLVGNRNDDYFYSHMHDKNPCLYILASVKEWILYIWVTSNLADRVHKHRSWFYSWFSSKYKTFKLVYYELHESMDEAIQKEKRMKKWKRRYKVNLIESRNPDWKDLFYDIIEDIWIPSDSSE